VAGRTFVIVGASLTGATAAATLRDQGFNGRLVLIGDETDLPYERPPLSKRYLRGERSAEELVVRPAGWWQEQDVDVLLGTTVDRVDARDRTVVLADGGSIRFDAALVATGVRNRRLDVPGADLDGVLQLRRIADADAIRERAASASRAVVVGMGFIGAEVAASFRTMGLDVTAVEAFETPLLRALGPELGAVVEAMHRDEGTELILGDAVERFEGGRRVERVRTRKGRTVPCDLVVVGVGTEPNVEVMAGEGISPIGGIAVDPTLRTSLPGVFAAGDVATHDHPVFGPVFGPVRVEHYDNALKMGAHVGPAMLGSTGVFDDPHWFWSDQFTTEIQMGGVRPTGDMVVRGSLQERRFCAFFLDPAGILRASVSVDWPRDCRRSLPLIRAGVAPDRAALVDPSVDLRTLDPARA
jgi:3-phenylpropionate/trans-cinnamate dioxygenase ferredoxin reductase subunit